MANPALNTYRRLDQSEGPALSSRRPWVTDRRTSLESMAYRVRLAVMGLAALGCIGAERGNPVWLGALPVLLVGVVVFLLIIGLQVLVSSRRRSRKLAKILVALVAGSVCGALWILLIDTVVTAATPEVMNESAVLGIGVVAALVAATLLSMPHRLSQVVGLSAMTIGFHSLAVPIAGLISLLFRRAQWVPDAGLRLAGDLPTVGLSVGGLLVGLILVFVGDQALRRGRTRRSRPRFDLSGPHA